MWTQLVLGALLVAPVPEADISRRLDDLLSPLPQAQVRCSARIVDLETGESLASAQPDVALIPASNAKLLVLAAAVDLLGPDFRFRTRFALRGGDLLVIGDGDPSLGDGRIAEEAGVPREGALDACADGLARAGVTRLSGDIVLDESIFDDQTIHPRWDADDLTHWYGAPVGALNFNDNCVDVRVWPAPSGGEILWDSFPHAAEIMVELRCRKAPKGTPVIDRPGAGLKFVVSGACSQLAQLQPVPVSDPGALFAAALRTALQKRGIAVAGGLRREGVQSPDGTLPPDCRVVAEFRSPLSASLARAGQQSQNLFAECLFKRVGYDWSRRSGAMPPIGSWETGRAAVMDLLERSGAPTASAVVADGSGLARDNRISADALVAVLTFMYRHPDRATFVESLATPGDDGTLRRRLKNVAGSVYAKTGYLRGVRTLSGYAVTPEGEWRAFAVLFNDFKGGSDPYNRIHDGICRILTGDAVTSSP